MEIDKTCILGLMASIIPFSHMNQSPRNMYYTSMGKQALSVPTLEYRRRKDMHMYVMNNLTRPLTTTKFDRYVTKELGNVPMGTSVILAIMPAAYNMEDSVILNKSSLDMGMFDMTYYRTYFSEARSKGSDDEYHGKVPDDVIGRKGNANYSKLGDNGIVPVGTKVKDGDVIIGKVARIQDCFDKNGQQISQWCDQSTQFFKISEGVVDRVEYTTAASGGHEMVWVRIRCSRRPIIGDKFASRRK